MRTRGKRADTSKYVHKKVAFCMKFVVFSYAKYVYHTLVFGIDFHLCFTKYLLCLFSSLSNVIQPFSVVLLIGCLKTLLLEVGGGGEMVRLHTQWGESQQAYMCVR